MTHLERMIEFTASCPFETRKTPFPDEPREAYREGLDHGEILFARRLRSALKKERSRAAA